MADAEQKLWDSGFTSYGAEKELKVRKTNLLNARVNVVPGRSSKKQRQNMGSLPLGSMSNPTAEVPEGVPTPGTEPTVGSIPGIHVADLVLVNGVDAAIVLKVLPHDMCVFSCYHFSCFVHRRASHCLSFSGVFLD